MSTSRKRKNYQDQVPEQTTLTDHDFSARRGRLNLRDTYPNLFNPTNHMRMSDVEDRIRNDRNIFRSTLNMDSDSNIPTEIDSDSNIPTEIDIVDDPTEIDNDVDDPTEIDNPVLPDTINTSMLINRSTNNGDKLWIDIRIPDNQEKYKLPYLYVNEEVKKMEKISKKNGQNIPPVIYAYKVIKGDGYIMEKYTPSYGGWEEVKSKVFRDYEDTKFYIEYLYNRTESIDEDVDNLSPDENSRVEKDILLLFRGEIDTRYPLTYKYDKEPTYLVDHCDLKHGCTISTYIYKSKIQDLNAKAGGFKRKSKKVKKKSKKSKKVKKNVSKRI